MPLNAAIIYPRDIASGGFLSVMKLLATLLRVGSIVYKKNRHTQMLNTDHVQNPYFSGHMLMTGISEKGQQ